MSVQSLCRDCLRLFVGPHECPHCHGLRVLRHDELETLSIAHIDCDAFYASVEKRDDPTLRNKPLIIGGEKRGVVATACYIARLSGVRSAMPMFEAKRRCPDAIIRPPRMALYKEVSLAIREKLNRLTPLIEPLSLDEAFLDLSGTQKLHKHPPFYMLAALSKEIKDDLGITISVGLSHNKFLAKIASDHQKPNGFFVIGRQETDAFLEEKPVNIIWGVGRSTTEALNRAGIRTIADLKRWELRDLMERFGSMGGHLHALARGLDRRRVSAERDVKSISNETTFDRDIGEYDTLEGHLYRLCLKVTDRAKAMDLIGRTITVKLKTADFKLLTKRISVPDPLNGQEAIFTAAQQLLQAQMPASPFRLIGVGLSSLSDANALQHGPQDLFTDPKLHSLEKATDNLRAKFGKDVITRGRALK